MTDTLWEELLRSPLDPDREPGRRTPRTAQLATLFILAIVGFMAGRLVFAGRDENASSALDDSSLTTSVTSPPATAGPILPPGFTEIDGVGIAPIATYSRSGNLYVIIAQAVRSDESAPETDAFHAGSWSLSGPGGQVAATRSIETSLAPGIQTLEFPGITTMPADARLNVRPGTEMVVPPDCQDCGVASVNEISGDVPLEGTQLPYDLASPLLIDAGSGITVSIDQLEFTGDWGTAAWHVVADGEVGVRLDLVVTFVGTATDDEETDTSLISTRLTPVNPQNPTVANTQPFSRAGATTFDRIGGLISGENPPTELLLHWDVQWEAPVGASVAVPAAGILDLGAVD